ncbi:MAG: hypothetical protein ACW99G_22730, partial [Candidatus Thorarchaeota archaeon]
MKEARVSAEQFVGAFVTLAEDDFAGAMERMARTIRGVQQNISDFIRTLFGLELLGPVMERIAAIAADALDAAFSPEVIRSFAIIGEVLLVSFDKIYFVVAKVLVPAIREFFAALGFGAPSVLKIASFILYATYALSEFIRALSRVIRGIADFVNIVSNRFGTTFAGIIQNAGRWGAGIVQALAEGMAGAISFLIDVLNAIARLFTFWLSTSSPPKLLPELTKWGKEAMESWLQGWTSADFGLFNDISRVVTSFVRSLKGKIPEADIIPRILGGRKAIQRAINDVRKFGEITEGSLNRIFRALKITSGPLRRFIRESFEFAKVTAIVEAAKKILDFDVEFEIPTQILGQTVTYLTDLVDLAKRFKGELGDALTSYVDALEDVRQANYRVARAQKTLNDLTERYRSILAVLRQQQDALKEDKDVSGRIADIEAALATNLLTDEERRSLELEKQEILLEHRINAVENERDVALDAAKKKLNAEQEIADAADRRLEFQKRLVQEIADEQLAAAREQLEAARGLVELQIQSNNLVQEQARTLARLAKEQEGFLEIPGLDFEGFSDDIESSLEASREAITQAIVDLRNEINQNIQAFIRDITEPFAGIPEKIRQIMTEIGLAFAASEQSESFQRVVESVRKFVTDMGIVLENLQLFWEENGAEIIAIIGDFFTQLAAVIPIEGILDTVAESISNFGDFLVGLSEQLVENGPQIQEALSGWVDWVFEEGIPKLVDFGKTIRDDVLPAIERFISFVVANAPTILPI